MEDIVFVNGSYRTPAGSASALARVLPSPWFYARAFSTVFRASRKAKRGRYGDREWCVSSFEILSALEEVGVEVDIRGVENFAKLSGPCVFIGNHMSTLETFVLPVVIEPRRHVTFVVKQSLVEYPVFRYVMRSRNPVTVGRENAREDLKAVLEGGAGRLKAGTSLIIFPQTTRKVAFEPSEFNSIGIKLAKRAGVPVVPVALKTDAWGNGRWLKDYGKVDPKKKVYFEFGAPLTIASRGDEEHAKIIAFIIERLRSWGGSVAGG